MKHILLYIITFLTAMLWLAACNQKKEDRQEESSATETAGPAFSADSAYAFCEQQCQFGPRVMNTEAHEQCKQWIADRFRQYGCDVVLQSAVVNGYDGTPLKATNIIARTPLATRQGGGILICAHWDSRPWADNDPDSANWRKPVMAANDGASGVGVMLELARLISRDDSLAVPVTFVCFDAEDWGTPQWEEEHEGDTWALGAQYWAAHLSDAEHYRYGILLDMVGGQSATFYQESFSKHYAQSVLDRVWAAARVVGYGSYFINDEGGGVTDDHVYVNRVGNIPCIDIVPHHPACEQSSFGPTWHTVNDDMQHLDKNTLLAVGQTLIQVLYSE